jgi:hypothetical protein
MIESAGDTSISGRRIELEGLCRMHTEREEWPEDAAFQKYK